MKRSSGFLVLATILLCITTTCLARPVVDTTKQQQQDSTAAGSQVEPNWFWFRPPFHFGWGWPPRVPIHSPAPHSAPHTQPKIPKWPFPHPPFPHFPIPKKPPSTSINQEQDLTAGSNSQVQPDWFSRGLPFVFRWPWLWPPHIPIHSPAPHSAPHTQPKIPKWPFPHPPFPHFPIPKKPPTTTTSLGLESAADEMNAASAVAVNDKCWSPLSRIDNCVNDIMSAFTTGEVKVNAACCAAIKNMEKDCQDSTIGSFANQRFTSAVTDYCSAI